MCVTLSPPARLRRPGTARARDRRRATEHEGLRLAIAMDVPIAVEPPVKEGGREPGGGGSVRRRMIRLHTDGPRRISPLRFCLPSGTFPA